MTKADKYSVQGGEWLKEIFDKNPEMANEGLNGDLDAVYCFDNGVCFDWDFIPTMKYPLITQQQFMELNFPESIQKDDSQRELLFDFLAFYESKINITINMDFKNKMINEFLNKQ